MTTCLQIKGITSMCNDTIDDTLSEVINQPLISQDTDLDIHLVNEPTGVILKTKTKTMKQSLKP